MHAWGTCLPTPPPTHTHTHTQIRTYVHTYIHTYIRTYISLELIQLKGSFYSMRLDWFLLVQMKLYKQISKKHSITRKRKRKPTQLVIVSHLTYLLVGRSS